MTSSRDPPLVSIIMPVYNGMATLERAARSVEGQTFADWELLVVDDGSTDGSAEAVAALAARDSRIRLIGSAENKGPGAARNLGLRSARGEFIRLWDDPTLYNRWSQAALHRAQRWLPDQLAPTYKQFFSTIFAQPGPPLVPKAAT